MLALCKRQSRHRSALGGTRLAPAGWDRFAELEAGEQTMVLVLPDSFAIAADSESTPLRVLVDAAQAQQLSLIIPLLEQKLLVIEREFRSISPMFELTVADVQARSQRYLDFLLPGLMAFTLMQLTHAPGPIRCNPANRWSIVLRGSGRLPVAIAFLAVAAALSMNAPITR